MNTTWPIWIFHASKTDCDNTFLSSAPRYRNDIALFEGFQTQPLVFMVRVVFMVEMSMGRWWNGVYGGKPMYSLLREKPVPGLCQVSLCLRRFFFFSIISPILYNHPHVNTTLIRRSNGWSLGAFAKLCSIWHGGALYRVIHKSLRDFWTRLLNNQDRHGRKEHINRQRISPSFFLY